MQIRLIDMRTSEKKTKAKSARFLFLTFDQRFVYSSYILFPHFVIFNIYNDILNFFFRLVIFYILTEGNVQTLLFVV